MSETLTLAYTKHEEDAVSTSTYSAFDIDLTENDWDAMMNQIKNFLVAVGYEFPAGTTLGVVADEE